MDLARPHWRLELLGAMRGRMGDRVLDRFQTQKTAALLAYLAYYPYRRHTREELVDLLWPDAELDAGRNRLSQAVGWLRGQLEPDGAPRESVLLADRHSVGLNPQAIVTDVAEFEAALQTSAGAADEDLARALRQAVDLYHGELLPGFYDDWLLAERQRLLGLYLPALRRLVDHCERRREWDRALDYARRALAADPFAEELHLDLMRLLAAAGQTSAALRQGREMERLLAKELEEEPSAAARELMTRIRQNAVPAALPLPTKRGAASLPPQMTRFFGREPEIAQVRALIETGDARLVTLAGMGGAGKTRLAIETARRLSAHFGDAVFFAPLADLSDSRLIPDALADLLLLPASGDAAPMERIVEALTAQRSLLVLDNLEHVIEGASSTVRSLLERVPSLTILVTSRQRLNIHGEREIDVPPLAAPPEGAAPDAHGAAPDGLMQIDSVRLFVDRAQSVRPSFTLTPQNCANVARLCARLDGLPLAIELCAAWAQTLTPAQMLAQLTRRFDLLVSRRTDIPTRHRTLRAALEYSYLLLPSPLQQFFVRLSVFRGGWTLEAADSICTDHDASVPLSSLEALTELRERSLIVAEESVGAQMRYRMLESLRDFAAEQRTLALDEPLRRKHAQYFLALASAASPQATGSDQAAWLERIENEHDNMRAVLAWTLETQEPFLSEVGLRLAVALTPFWEVRGYLGEGQHWLEQILAKTNAPEISPEARAQALTACGQMARARGDFAAAERYIGEALTLWRALEDDHGVAASLLVLATLTYFRVDYDGARAYLEEALVRARRLGDLSVVAAALLNLGNIAMEERHWPEAWALYSESLEMRRREGNPKRLSDALNNLGLVARYRGDLEAAHLLMAESLAICRTLSDRSGVAITLLNQGTIHRLSDRFAEATAALDEAAAISSEIGNMRVIAWCVKEFGHLACAQGDFARGVRLLASSETQRTTLGMSFHPADPDELTRDTTGGEAALGAAGFAAAWTAGGALSPEDALREGRTSPA